MRVIPCILIASTLLCTPALAQSYPSIVGEWHTKGAPEDCGTPWSLHIFPMSMAGGEMACEFDSVVRDQWMVTWTGECGNVDYEKTKVVAVEDAVAEELHIAFSSTGYTEVLQSCTPR